MTDPARAKSLLRARLLGLRGDLSAQHRSEAARHVCGRLLQLPEVAEAEVVAAFCPVGTEIAIEAALAALLGRRVQLLLPWVEGPVTELAPVRDLERDLVPGWRGVREPARRVATPPGLVDVAIVPGVGFDRGGTRLGYGGGHFDRLLARLRPGTPVIAPAFAVQVLEALPREAHDVPVDVVVTEGGVHRVP